MTQYRRGRAHLDQQEFAAAQICFRTGLQAGDPKCAYGLLAAAAGSGEKLETYWKGLEEALPALETLAQEGDSEACFIIGRCYETGSVFQQDIHSAMKYYTKAASVGNADAMYNLGCIYMGFGPGGVRIALDYFQQAAEKGCSEAKAALQHYEQTQKQENG